MSKSRHFDHVIFFVVVALMGFGLVMVYSASSVTSMALMADGLFYFKRQLIWVVLGILTMLIFSLIDYHKLEVVALPALIFSILCLILVLIPGVAPVIGGARRWLRFGGFGFQPSEMAKVCFVLYMAANMARKQNRITDFVHGVLPNLLITLVAAILIVKEPNLSTASILCLTFFLLLYFGNGSLLHLGGFAFSGALLLLSLIFQAGYRMRRFWAFLDPWSNAQTSGYHIIQSLIAIGSGGLWGRGLGQSAQKFFLLPERHTDFIFAIICEELGLIGGTVVIILFVLLLLRGFYIANRAPDMFGFLLASGIVALISVQTLINLGVVLSLLPTTGVTLPFVSYGGSSLIFLAAAVGMVLNVSRYGAAQHAFTNVRARPFSRQYIDPGKNPPARRRN